MNATEVARVKSMGFSAYLEVQLSPASIDDSAFENRIRANYRGLLSYTPRQMSDIYLSFDGNYTSSVAWPWQSSCMNARWSSGLIIFTCTYPSIPD